MPRSVTDPAIGVRPMHEHDLVRAARLHRQHLPHGLFPSLGERFLRRYLTTYLNTPSAVALAIEGEAGTFAFLCGTVDRRAHRAHVLHHHAGSLVRAGLLSLTLHPTVAVRFMRTRAWHYLMALLRLGRRKRGEAPTTAGVWPAVLAHLVVAPQSRCAGAGAALVDAFEAVARERGLARAELLTLPGDAGAGGFYERLGWRSGELCSDRDGVTWVRYQKSLI
jgi:GNAT superfamily N-acetyltransferase